MQTCEFYQEQISRMIDGDLSEIEQMELCTHLEQCVHCHNIYEVFSTVSTCLSGSELPPVDFSAGIMEQIQQSVVTQRPLLKSKNHFSFPRLTAMAAGFVLILFAAFRFPFWSRNDADKSETASDSCSISDNAVDMTDDMELPDNDNHANGESESTGKSTTYKDSTERSEFADVEETTTHSLNQELYNCLALLELQHSNSWIAAIAELCMVCTVTEGQHTPQFEPNAFYSLAQEGESEYCEISVWQIDTRWILFIRLADRAFTLRNEYTVLQQDAPDAYAWISSALSN